MSGLAQRIQVSAAVGAFLVGIALSGPLAKQAHRVISPVRDLFAAVFFFFFGLQVAPKELLPVLPLAMALVVITAATKLLSGWWAARLAALSGASALRVGATLIARGEFSIVIAGLAVAAGAEAESRFGRRRVRSAVRHRRTSGRARRRSDLCACSWAASCK